VFDTLGNLTSISRKVAKVSTVGIFLLGTVSLFAQFSGGNGTAESPFEIRTRAELENVSLFPDKHFVLKANIRDSLRTPLCYEYDNPFTGVFNGNGYKITLAMNEQVYNVRVGLFAYVRDTAIIKNVVIDGYIKGEGIAASIVAHSQYNSNLQIINCINMAKITGTSTGGIISVISDSNTIIKNCINIGSIKSINLDAGGIVAQINPVGFSLTVKSCINSGFIYGSSDSSTLMGCGTAGIAGHSYDKNGTISNCINIGVITGITNELKKVGGIVPIK